MNAPASGNSMSARSFSRPFAIFSRVVVFFSILLIWWGAATTTEEAGMVFADWPLSLGSVNPPGWLKHTAPFLEHSHRLLATLVGLLTLVLFAWTYAGRSRRWVEIVLVVLMLAGVFALFIAAGAERADAARKQTLLSAALAASFVPAGWLSWSWRFRDWRTMEKLCALALLLVTAQAILGGLRVTEISNTFAVVHGCLAQGFFCLLLLIALRASRNWERLGFSRDQRRPATLAGAVLTGMVLVQLLLGASMRHFHRSGLADEGLFLTQGRWIPSFEEPIIAVMFLHKANAYLVLAAVVGAALLLWSRGGAAIRRHLGLLLGLLAVQIGLGLTVIATGKHFWLTNFHVLTGLAIFALSFIFLVRAAWVRMGPRTRPQGEEPG